MTEITNLVKFGEYSGATGPEYSVWEPAFWMTEIGLTLLKL